MGTALVPFLLCAMAAVAADDGLQLTVHRIANREAILLRAGSAPNEGMAEIPFVYQVVQKRVLLDKRGLPIGPEVTLRMERIPLDGGSYYRCLGQNGGPCLADLVTSLENDERRRGGLSAAEREIALHNQMIRLHQRRLFWQQFPTEFEFKQGGANEIRFGPRKSSKAAAIQGSLRYDTSTFEVLHMDYTFVGESSVGLTNVPSGTSFSMEMVRGGELYSLVRIIQRLPQKGGIQEAIAEYTQFRRFAADSRLIDDAPDGLESR